jgi:hypothetical protein
MSWLNRLFERFGRRIQAEAGGPLAERKGVVRVGPPPFEGVAPHPENIEKYERLYRESSLVNSAVNSLTDMIVGAGYFTEADEEEEAKRLVDEYAEVVNLDGLLRRICQLMLIYGFAPVERWWANGLLNLKPLPPRTVYIRLDEKGRLLGYRQRTWSGRSIDFNPEEIIWICHSELPGQPYGVSLIEPVINLIEYKQEILEDLCRIVHRYASPLNIWITRADISPIKSAVEQREPDEDIFIGRASKDDVEIKTLEMDPRGRYTDYLNVINEEIYEALKAPFLVHLRNATEASARVQLEVIQRHVEGIQRYLKRIIEGEIFRPMVEKHGLGEVPRLRWGRPSTGVENISVEDVARLVQAYVITSKQAVELLKKMGLPIEAEEEKKEN